MTVSLVIPSQWILLPREVLVMLVIRLGAKNDVLTLCAC